MNRKRIIICVLLSGYAPQTDSKLFSKLVDYCINKGCTFTDMMQLMDMYSYGTNITPFEET